MHAYYIILIKTYLTMVNFNTSNLSNDNDFKRNELIVKIEHAIEHMTLKELEALSYDMFTKGYIDEY